MKALLKTLIVALSLMNTVDAQFLTKNQKDFITDNVVVIEVDDNYLNGNWKPVVEEMKGKRLVLLGEFNHGSKEVFLSRNELIKSLHANLGFNLIFFESGIGEVGVINLMKNDLDKAELTSGFFGGWRTSEFENLLQYARANNINIGGFDVQRTGSTFTNYFAENLEDAQTFQELEKSFIAIKSKLSDYRTEYDSIKYETEEVINDYHLIINSLEKEDSFKIRTLTNRVAYLTYMLTFIKTKDWNDRWEARDLAMAENIKWLLNQYGPNQKAIIIAHNYHISRNNKLEEVMGEFLVRDFGDDMYVLGTFAKEGTYLNNSGRPESLSKPDTTSLDIKHIIDTDGVKMSFLDLPIKMSVGSKWLQEPIIINDTFIDLSNSNRLILSKCFDGLLLIDTVSPPIK